MRRHIIRPIFISIPFVLAACGVSPPPGGGDDDVQPTPPPLGDSTQPKQEVTQPVQPACDYTEANDATNDYLAASGYTLEDSGITFSGTPKTICGVINNGHFDDYYYSVDVDNYGLTLATDADVIVTLTGDAAAIANVGVWAYDPNAGEGAGGGVFVGDHGVFAAHLAAGSYEFSVEAYDDFDAAAPIPYKVRIAGDDPVARCAQITTFATYTESLDGAGSTDNDMVDIDYTAWPTKWTTDSTTDAPEPTGMAFTGGAHYRISGIGADVPADGSYFDRDTYLITTGAATNQMTIRLDWANANADFDYFLFPVGSTIAYGWAAKQQVGNEEFATFPVMPNSQYWLWVGAGTDSTAMPAAYDATVCGETFVAQ